MACSARDWTPQRSKAISTELQLPRPKTPPSPFSLSLYFFLDPPLADPPQSGWLQHIWPQQKMALFTWSDREEFERSQTLSEDLHSLQSSECLHVWVC